MNIKLREEISLKKSYIFVRFFVFFIPLMLLLYGTIWGIYYSAIITERQMFITQEQINVNGKKEIILNSIELISSDVLYISELNDLVRFLAHPGEREKRALENTLFSF